MIIVRYIDEVALLIQTCTNDFCHFRELLCWEEWMPCTHHFLMTRRKSTKYKVLHWVYTVLHVNGDKARTMLLLSICNC